MDRPELRQAHFDHHGRSYCRHERALISAALSCGDGNQALRASAPHARRTGVDAAHRKRLAGRQDCAPLRPDERRMSCAAVPAGRRHLPDRISQPRASQAGLTVRPIAPFPVSRNPHPEHPPPGALMFSLVSRIADLLMIVSGAVIALLLVYREGTQPSHLDDLFALLAVLLALLAFQLLDVYRARNGDRALQSTARAVFGWLVSQGI